MLFKDKKSGLVKLTDSIKININDCLQLTAELIDCYEHPSGVLSELHAIAKEPELVRICNKIENKENLSAVEKIKFLTYNRTLENLSHENSIEDAGLVLVMRGKLDQRSVSLILNCHFCTESYVRSFYHFFKDELVNTVTQGKFDDMGTKTRLETFGLTESDSNGKNIHPLVLDFEILSRYRNDFVHGNITNTDTEKALERYKGKLPDQVFGLLDLSHVVFAADTYWKIVDEIHKCTGLKKSDFHKHYNLSPWFDADFESEVRKMAERFSKIESSH